MTEREWIMLGAMTFSIVIALVACWRWYEWKDYGLWTLQEQIAANHQAEEYRLKLLDCSSQECVNFMATPFFRSICCENANCNRSPNWSAPLKER